MINDLLLKRAEKLIQKDPSLHGFKAGDRDELIALSSAMLGKTPCKGCPGEQHEIFIELRSLVNKLIPNPNSNQMKNENSKFSIAAGVTLHDLGRGKVFTETNLTDEDAMDLLSRNPRAIGQFKSYPKNWKDLVSDFADEKEAEKKAKAKAKAKAGEELAASKAGKPGKPAAAKPAADKKGTGKAAKPAANKPTPPPAPPAAGDKDE